VVQRVKSASVSVDGKVVSRIDRGLLVFLGVADGDAAADLESLSDKVAGLRIFPKDGKESDASVMDAGGEILVVSQFTIMGDVRKGKRPSFSGAMEPGAAADMYLRSANLSARRAYRPRRRVRAMMDVALVNDGPYTILIDSKKAF
jgi:D-tyrosyl-tRNA(Tyr) deacylase